MSKPKKYITFYPPCKVTSYPDSLVKLAGDERMLVGDSWVRDKWQWGLWPQAEGASYSLLSPGPSRVMLRSPGEGCRWTHCLPYPVQGTHEPPSLKEATTISALHHWLHTNVPKNTRNNHLGSHAETPRRTNWLPTVRRRVIG